MAKKKRAPGGGRKPQDPSGKKRRVVIWLTPSECQHLSSLGGSVQGGLRQLLAREMERQ